MQKSLPIERCATCSYWGSMKGRDANYCPIEHSRVMNIHWCSQWRAIKA